MTLPPLPTPEEIHIAYLQGEQAIGQALRQAPVVQDGLTSVFAGQPYIPRLKA